MRIINGRPPRARYLARGGADLSRAARLRLHWMDYYQTHQHKAALTCRHFGISRQTFYGWKRRYDPQNLTSLEERSHRPRRLRQPTWTPQLAERVLHLRRQYPRWGKDKLVVLLRREGRHVSTSMVGRILAHWKARGRLVELLPNGFKARQRRSRMPFPVRALQVDGGSEFAAAFEQACQQRGLRLFVLPPRSPKLNGHVERANRTHTEEFYEVTPCSLQIPALNQELLAWERTYNTVRPHQALGYQTPQEFLHQWRS